MKKLSLYIIKEISSISKTKELIAQEKSFQALRYVGSVIQLGKGKLVYEGITPEFKKEIQELVEEIIVKRESEVTKKETIQMTTKSGRVLKETLPYPCKPNEPEFLDTLNSELLRGHYKLFNEDIFTEVEEITEIKK